ncbi:MAG: ABC transporter permease [Chloroflexota bacterium]|nr:MAG: ABC transporter permease [Chloroflexota bacterium]
MFLLMVRRSVTKGWRKKALAVITVAIGTSLAVAMLNVSLDIGDKVDRELKSYGANIEVIPKVETIPLEIEGVDFSPIEGQGFLAEAELPKVKTIFWQNNILGFAPYLNARAEAPGEVRVPVIGTWFRKSVVIPTGETLTTGVSDIKSWWEVDGAWPDDEPGGAAAVVGQAVARRFSLKPGDSLSLSFLSQSDRDYAVRVSGILSAGGEEDKQVFVPLSWLQEVTMLPGKVSRVEVSALTMPKNALARKAEELGPDALSRQEFDTWYCSPYVDSVVYQLEEALPGARARAIRQIAESEGVVLGKVQFLMALLALAAVVSSALGISSLMGAAALERSQEIGLLKAVGAYDSSVTWLFLAEALLIGVIGGAVGCVVGLGLAAFIAQSVFAAAVEVKTLTIVAAFAISVSVTLLGILSVSRIVSRLQPSQILVGR